MCSGGVQKCARKSTRSPGHGHWSIKGSRSLLFISPTPIPTRTSKPASSPNKSPPFTSWVCYPSSTSLCTKTLVHHFQDGGVMAGFLTPPCTPTPRVDSAIILTMATGPDHTCSCGASCQCPAGGCKCPVSDPPWPMCNLSAIDLPRFCRNKPHVASPEPSRNELIWRFSNARPMDVPLK